MFTNALLSFQKQLIYLQLSKFSVDYPFNYKICISLHIMTEEITIIRNQNMYLYSIKNWGNIYHLYLLFYENNIFANL